jgi:hypothetical protein
VRITITPSRRVRCEATLHLPLSASRVWGQLRDFRTYASHDFFHASIAIDGHIPREGAALVLEHRYLLFRVRRVGRILRFRDNLGFAYSDLHAGDPQRSFPHVFSLTLTPLDVARCHLHICVTGRWTAPLPRWMGRMWLWWVFVPIVQHTHNRLLAFHLATRSRADRFTTI